MKLLTMKCIRDPYLSKDSSPVGGKLGQVENFVKFEDAYEDIIYSDASESWDDNDYADFNKWLNDNIGITDYDVYTYFMSSEPEPAVGEQYTDADGLVWERVE